MGEPFWVDDPGFDVANHVLPLGTLRRAALATGEDLLRPAPASALNARIGPRRALVRHTVDLDDVRAVKRAAGATVNDVCLALVAGALRAVAVAAGEEVRPLKAMVPVNLRADGETSALGNRISFAFVPLPVDASSGRARLARIRRATAAFKREDRPAGAQTVFAALGPAPPQAIDAALRELLLPPGVHGKARGRPRGRPLASQHLLAV